jgi:hypothetical protein
MQLRELKLRLALTCQEHFPIPLYWGFESPAIYEAEPPFIYLDHAYFDRGYDKMNFRVILNGIHQTAVRHDLPDDRMLRFCPLPRPWKQGSKVIVIPVQPNPARLYGEEDWTDRTVETLKKHTDREIIVKDKASGPLAPLLHDAWAVVSHSSVAAVEAAYLGVPVFGPATSPAYYVGEEELSEIESPATPQRDAWLRTLSYSQFHLSEIRSGLAWEVIEAMYGDQHTDRAQDGHSILVAPL